MPYNQLYSISLSHDLTIAQRENASSTLDIVIACRCLALYECPHYVCNDPNMHDWLVRNSYKKRRKPKRTEKYNKERCDKNKAN